MYSRYTVKAPQAPPDYGGTAFNPAVMADPLPTEEAVTDKTDIKEIEISEPGDSIRPTPTDAYYADKEQEVVAAETEEVRDAEGNTENVISDIHDAAVGKSDVGFSLDDLTLDDLLFMGALILLMSGKMGDESMLLLSYLLTCGL